MEPYKTLISQEDASVNFVFENGVEARYVRRSDDYAIVYLSSHNGCNKACRFCHLTQTGQTEMRETSAELFIEQAKVVLDHYRFNVRKCLEKPVETIHFNWMARGEPLSNQTLLNDWYQISLALEALANVAGVYKVKFNISTIMPEEADLTFFKRVPPSRRPAIYYSLYSMKTEFRKRWLPKAMDPYKALMALQRYNASAGDEVVLHWAFIEGENDDEFTVQGIANAVQSVGLYTRFNLVRYNPYSPVQGKEPSEEVLQERFDQLKPYMRAPGSRIVPRVGRDVYASCGTFINLADDPK